LKADDKAITPPYLIGDREARGIQDLSNTYTMANVKGLASTKRFFHRLFPRAEGRMFYCNVIRATSKSPSSFMDALSIHLRDNKMGLWQRSIDAEQVSEIGWLLYSTRQQDEKRISTLLSVLTEEKIGGRWRIIHTSTSFRWQKAHKEKTNGSTGNSPRMQC
jgi:hypothetical protein